MDEKAPEAFCAFCALCAFLWLKVRFVAYWLTVGEGAGGVRTNTIGS